MCRIHCCSLLNDKWRIWRKFVMHTSVEVEVSSIRHPALRMHRNAEEVC